MRCLTGRILKTYHKIRKKFFGSPTSSLKKINWYSIYSALYASIGSTLCFLTIRWVDSHAKEFYSSAYTYRFGCDPTIFSIIQSLLIFIGLLSIYRVEQLDYVVAGVLSSSLILFSQLICWLGLSFREPGPFFVIGLSHSFLAVIVGLTFAEHFYSFLYPHLDISALKRDYEEHLKILGYLMQSITLIFVFGGLFIVMTTFTQVELLPFLAETRQPWGVGVILEFLYFAHGAYFVFLLRYFLDLINLKMRIQKLGKESNENS